MTDQPRDGRFERLWLRTLEALIDATAHDLRNVLNGVAVNLEVVRSRSARAGSTGEQIAPFAQSASGQLETATARMEALLNLTRPAKRPVDVGRMLTDVIGLLRAKAPAGSSIEGLPSGEWIVDGDPEIIRLAMVRLALDGLAAGSLRAAAGRADGGVQVRLDVRPSAETSEALALAVQSGLTVQASDGVGVVLNFQAAAPVGP